MRTLLVVTLLALLFLPTGASAEVQTFTATHIYILGDHDSKDDARQRCLLEAKRKVLEQAGVYMESASEVKDFQLTKDKITSFASAVMQVKDTKEKFGFENGHMTLALTIKADVDLVEVRKQLAARQVDAGVRDEVAQQKERLKSLEAKLEGMHQRRQVGQAPGQTYAPSLPEISAADVQTVHMLAVQGNAKAQAFLGSMYANGIHDKDFDRRVVDAVVALAKADLNPDYLSLLEHIEAAANGYEYSVPQDYVQARQWFEKAVDQDDMSAQVLLGVLYAYGLGVPKDSEKARQLYARALAQLKAIQKQPQSRQVPEQTPTLPSNGISAVHVQRVRTLATQGDADSQYILGMMYDGGEGVPQDRAQAAQWYEQAAAQGLAEAQVTIGIRYIEGQGVQKDYAQGRWWFEKAAVQGDARAHAWLGLMYSYGQGVPKDYARAYMWLNLASVRLKGEFQKSVARYLDDLARRMPPAQVAEGEQLAQQCQARQFKGC